MFPLSSIFVRLVTCGWLLGIVGVVRAEETIPILAWHGPPAKEATAERYREMAEAGFTQSFSGFGNVEAMERALDVAKATGLRLWVSVPELQAKPEDTVKRLMSHPAVAGYYLRDEPNVADFPGLSAWAKRIQAVDAVHPCYINLFPNYADAGQLGVPTYAGYVARFLAEVPVPFVSFDHYPVVGESVRGEWYENLEIISSAAAAAKKPFWGFVLMVAHNPYPVPTIEHARLQAFSNLAYGAQAIQHFTYWTPESTVWNFHQAPIEKDGKRTATYDVARQINAEIRGLSKVFLGGRVVTVGHLGGVPRGAKAFEPAADLPEVHADGPALISVVEKGAKRHLVVVNRALKGDRRVEITFRAGMTVTRIQKNGEGLAVKEGKIEVVISPGDVAIFQWTKT
jgi:hypothetical protein